MVLAFDGEAPPGCFDVAIPTPPSDDPFIRQELTETYYHLLWELVHVFFEHGGRQSAGGGAASFLYPFLDDKATDVDARARRRRRARCVMKADEIGALREQTLTEGRRDAARGGARSCARGSTPAARCSRSATAARRPTRWTWSPTSAPPRLRRAALDLTEDPAIITALANDIGTDAIFSRQVIAYGGPGDALIALSTSGNSGNVIAALVEARKRGLMTIALRRLRRRAGRGGRARRPRRRHPLRAHPADPGGAGERVPRAPRAGGMRRVRARVEGTVQGVGFRPFVYRLAAELDLAGFVLNDERGVLVEVEGGDGAVDGFLRRLAEEAPPLASVEAVRAERRRARGRARLPHPREPARRRARRRSSRPTPRRATTACAELFDPADRRYRYPFVNCTNCGPRFTIVRGVPYDRPLTTMAGFEMCPRCAAEYEDPADRRFHAQPNACPECGPTLRLLPGDQSAATTALRAAVAALREGAVVAVKGIGGYHLACLAAREPRGRGAAGAQAPRGQAVRGDGARRRGRARARLADRRGGGAAGRPRPPDRARAAPVRTRRWPPRSRRARADLGVLLPYSPLHHLLLADAGEPLVMTSGNVSDEPIAYEDEDALARLAGHRRPRPPPRPPDPHAHGRLGAARGPGAAGRC